MATKYYGQAAKLYDQKIESGQKQVWGQQQG